MNDNALNPSPALRKMSLRALSFILLFVFTYVLLIAFAVALISACIFLAYLFIQHNFTVYTAVPGLMLVAMSVTVFIFVIKFVFKRSVKQEIVRVKVTPSQEPELFALISDVAAQLKSGMPRSVYLSPDDNANVSYGSPFLSMFFPLRANLLIGMALINTHSIEELKGIIAHELGHCTQSGMRLGVYVSNANSVLHNMLYDNDAFDRTLEAWADGVSYFRISAKVAALFIQAIRYILQQLYEALNINNLALSREMEYHADALAAMVVGSAPVLNGLSRSTLSGISFDCVYSYHERKINGGFRPLNIYPQQTLVMKHLAKTHRLKMEDDLPFIDPDMIWKLRGSKIIFADQWSTHPDMEHRINRVKNLDIQNKFNCKAPALSILIQKDYWQETLSEKLFERYFTYDSKPEVTGFEMFRDDFLEPFSSDVVDERYHGYYDAHLPYYKFDQELLHQPVINAHNYDDLFNQQGLDELIEFDVLERDLTQIKGMQQKPEAFNLFYYEDTIYNAEYCWNLVRSLEIKKDKLQDKINLRSLNILDYFKGAAQDCGHTEDWKQNYLLFKEVTEISLSCQDRYVDLGDKCLFMYESTPLEKIRLKMADFRTAESLFKDRLSLILNHSAFRSEMTAHQMTKFETYLASDIIYFEGSRYIDEHVDQLANLAYDFRSIYHAVCLKHKIKFLNDQLALLPVLSPVTIC